MPQALPSRPAYEHHSWHGRTHAPCFACTGNVHTLSMQDHSQASVRDAAPACKHAELVLGNIHQPVFAKRPTGIFHSPLLLQLPQPLTHCCHQQALPGLVCLCTASQSGSCDNLSLRNYLPFPAPAAWSCWLTRPPPVTATGRHC